VEEHEWKSDGKCDRRMRCVGGPCKWTVLAKETIDRTPDNAGAPVFQRREASPQIGIEVRLLLIRNQGGEGARRLMA
jgi:hypothetical protein